MKKAIVSGSTVLVGSSVVKLLIDKKISVLSQGINKFSDENLFYNLVSIEHNSNEQENVPLNTFNNLFL